MTCIATAGDYKRAARATLSWMVYLAPSSIYSASFSRGMGEGWAIIKAAVRYPGSSFSGGEIRARSMGEQLSPETAGPWGEAVKSGVVAGRELLGCQ